MGEFELGEEKLPTENTFNINNFLAYTHHPVSVEKGKIESKNIIIKKENRIK